MKNMKKLRVTLVSENVPKGCGLDTYYANLAENLKKNKVDTCSLKALKLFGNYPVSLSSSVKTDVVHFTDQKVAPILLLSPFRKYKSVLTVHDIIEIINFKNIYGTSSIKSFLVHKIWGWIMKKGMGKADIIIAVSEHTKKDITRLIGKRSIEVVYESADRKFRPQKVRKYQYTVLYMGSNLPHKNLITLLKAFSVLIKRTPQAKLVLISGALPKDKRLFMDLKKLNIDDKVVFKGYVEDTPPEYSKAGVFVLPSLYEGFGLPILEAMSCGCPVICSDKTSLPEVAGDAAIYFDGYDADDLAEKMHRVLTDKKLQDKLRKKGLERAKEFSWEKCAEQTIAVYKRMMK